MNKMKVKLLTTYLEKSGKNKTHQFDWQMSKSGSVDSAESYEFLEIEEALFPEDHSSQTLMFYSHFRANTHRL